MGLSWSTHPCLEALRCHSAIENWCKRQVRLQRRDRVHSDRSLKASRALGRLRRHQSTSSVLVVVVVVAAFLVADQREGTLPFTEVLEVALELFVVAVVM